MGEAYLRFWGVRGSYAAPFSTHLKVGGNTSCVEIRANDHVLVCDAGTGIIPFGNRMMQQDRIRELLIILTHYHWDHVCGLPFFVPAFSPQWKINFFGPGQNAKEVEKHVSAQMRAPYFPVGTETWLAKVNYLNASHGKLKHGPFEISYQNVHHPGVTYGYQVRVGGKLIIYISDNESLFLHKTIDRRRDEFSDEENTLFDAMKKEEYDSALQFIRNADILIHDAQYTPEDYEKKRGWGHSCYIDTVNCAIDAGAKELYLYHHDPNYDDDLVAEIHKDCLKIIRERRSALQCHIAREGLTIDLS
jgi:phosphoribosyl 1,2-cyclic phosphodiesterase